MIEYRRSKIKEARLLAEEKAELKRKENEVQNNFARIDKTLQFLIQDNQELQKSIQLLITRTDDLEEKINQIKEESSKSVLSSIFHK